MIVQRIAWHSNRRERELLGFDYETCMTLKFPPCRLMVDFEMPVYRRELCQYSGGRNIYWSEKQDGKGIAINRKVFGDEIKDAYGIDDCRYTHYFNYLNGEIHMYPDHGFTSRDEVSTAVYTLGTNGSGVRGGMLIT